MTTNSILALAGRMLAKLSLFVIFLAVGGPVYAREIASPKQTITGKVTDKTSGEALPGVNVLIEGSMIGTTTTAEGNFSLEVTNENAILVFSYVGYTLQKVPVAGRSVLDIQLEVDLRKLEEVVVVGYGTQKKSDITGAISSISTKALKEVPVTNVPQMLQGRVAGVYVLNTSNKPGAGVSVQIRGRRSFSAGNDPLYVVDGVPISGGFNDINPGDIEGMEILKDASATAIYGSRGANGVIIITTKRGGTGKPTVSYSNYVGSSQIQRYADLMNGEEFAEFKRESRRAVINTSTGKPLYDDTNPNADAILFEPVELASIKEGKYTDWQRLMIGKGNVQNHELGVSGGNENTRYNMALGYFRDIGIIAGQDFTRYTARVNLDQNLGNRFKAGVSLLSSYSERNGEDVNPYGQGADFGALSENPLGKAYDENGELIFLPTTDGLRSNPLSELVPGAVINRTKRIRLLSNFYGEAEIIEGLRVRMNFAPDISQNKKGDFRGRYTNVRRLGDPSAASNEEFTFAYTWENIVTYKKRLGTKHTLDFTGLYSLQTRQFERSSVNVSGLPIESFEYYNLGAASIVNSVGSEYEKWSILSYMARVNYAFENRFLLTLTGRADGSSKFAEGKKWGYFPSAALGWNITNERFMADSRIFTNLKLRVSYGSTGNEGILPYQTNGLLARTQYDFDGNAAFGYRPSSIRNSDLRWETTTTANVGIDFGIFNNRITGALELYQSKTTDLLLPKLLPITSGFNSIIANVGSKRNRGVEFAVSTLNIAAKNAGGFEWSTDLNLFTNQEEILELSQGKVDDIGNLRFIGQPAVVYFDFVKTGIWQEGEAELARKNGSIVGGIKVQDVNQNGVIDQADRQILGSDVPKLIGGMTQRFEYKGFDLSVLVFSRFGSTIQSPFHGSFRFLSGRINQYNVDYWTKNNPTNAYPQPNANQVSPIYGSTLSYMDGSFTKIRNINLGYNFSSQLAGKLKMQSLRVYVSAQNPFVFSPYTSKYNGIDPEFPTTSTPPVRTFLAGLTIKF